MSSFLRTWLRSLGLSKMPIGWKVGGWKESLGWAAGARDPTLAKDVAQEKGKYSRRLTPQPPRG
jgi:hypothetical protein